MPSPGRGGHLLLIDDDSDSRELYRQMLEWSGFDVETASNGTAALRAARARKPDLILLDLLMPGMDGGVVLQHLRKDALTRAVPVVAVTGVPEWLQDHKEVSTEFDGVLLKPVSSEQLVREIQRVLTSCEHARRTPGDE